MVTMNLDIRSTVGEWVVDRPSRSRVFEELGIDYCCGGKQPLEDACRDKGLAAEQVVRALLAVDEPTGTADRDWSAALLSELCDHIEATHHEYLRRELPRLASLTEKVAKVHGPNHGEMIELHAVVAGLKAELGDHMMKEEQILFPMIRELEHAVSFPSFHCGSIGNPIRVMEFEHDSAGGALARMRELTHDHSCPDDACNTWRAMVDGLRQLETDLHQHIHKENNILFPRALRRERELA
ncbi:MAG: iron-sulfur cluster repair di-iron protein [Planctomycetes bacterium]|nr:iron-sulfur cluster repair di-iron protein [Planctomycetota bacterium]